MALPSTEKKLWNQGPNDRRLNDGVLLPTSMCYPFYVFSLSCLKITS